MRYANAKRLMVVNALVLLVSLGIIWVFDWPTEAIGTVGLSWVLTSSISMIIVALKGGISDEQRRI